MATVIGQGDSLVGQGESLDGSIYLGRRGTHFIFRLTLQGKPIVAYYPAWLVDRRGPHPIDCTTVAHGDERMPPSVPVSEGHAALGELGKDGFAREREKKGPVALTANEIFADRTIAG
jgi:hypothetical protein